MCEVSIYPTIRLVQADDIAPMDRSARTARSRSIETSELRLCTLLEVRILNVQGVGLGFGPDVTKRWCELNKVTAVIRSHEVRQDGYAIEHDGLCITTFSCPNYCDTTGNKVCSIFVASSTREPTGPADTSGGIRQDAVRRSALLSPIRSGPASRCQANGLLLGLQLYEWDVGDSITRRADNYSARQKNRVDQLSKYDKPWRWSRASVCTGAPIQSHPCHMAELFLVPLQQLTPLGHDEGLLHCTRPALYTE